MCNYGIVNLHSAAQKYKEYSKLRSKLSAPVAPETPSKRASHRRSTHDVQQTPKGPPKALLATPIKRKRENEDGTDHTPASQQFLSPQGPSFIGPTPQRDGIVLGLFDNLPAGTPSKRRAVLGDVEVNVAQTPSRAIQEAESEASLESRARGERTPLSAGKRFLFSQFITPKKRKLDEEGTPSSTLRGLATPAFLRRNNVLNDIDEVDETTPRPAPWKRRSLGRSLSAMVQAMKKEEDDRLDEEADIMREMEMEELGVSIPKKISNPNVQVEDSQVVMPLGPDRGVESDEDDDPNEEPELDPDGKPRKAWKKKGLKRQTRRVISKTLSVPFKAYANHPSVRPNITKPKSHVVEQTQVDSEDDEDKVADTQVNHLDLGIDDDEESDYASDASHTPKQRKAKPEKGEDAKDAPKEGALKTAGRKIKATAHANYRRLKIKSVKGASGAKGRFGRRR